MKYAVDHARRATGALILPHFFNARGAGLERSVEGMYRTLAVWLLDELENVIKKDLATVYLTGHQGDSWPLAELERLLKDAIRNMKDRPITIFVDALDECPREEVQRMLGMFRDLVWKAWAEGHGGTLRLCFASRPYPNITFHDAVFVDLGNHLEHSRDISAYIDDCLRIGESEVAVQIRRTIHAKAAGIFMCATLVVRDMNQEYDDGNVHRLQLRLQHIPETLHELYRHTLKRYPESRDVLLVCVRWTLFALEPLNTRQLWWGIQLGLGRDEDDFVEEYHLSSELDIARQIVSISRGLLAYRSRPHFPAGITPGIQTARNIEANARESYVVTFAHESVRDFIFREQALHGARSRDEFVGQSHERLRDWCCIEWRRRQPQVREELSGHPAKSLLSSLDSRLDYSLRWTDPDPRYPLAVYAGRRAIFHSEEAQRHGKDQATFIRNLESNFGSAALSFDGSLHSLATRGALFRLLLITRSASLIARTQLEPARIARGTREAFLIRPDIFKNLGQPRFAPYAHLSSQSSEETMSALFSVYMELEPRQHRFQQILGRLLSRQHIRTSTNALQVLCRAEPSLLTLSETNPVVAIFFLLVLASPNTLDPHLDMLESLLFSDLIFVRGRLVQSSDLLRFLQTMQYFIMHDICSDAIKLEGPILILWYRQSWTRNYFDCVFDGIELNEACRVTMADTEAFLLGQ